MPDTEYKAATGHSACLRTVATACLMLWCATATADNTNASPDAASAYIDSVNSWGTWELGIEPAAGPQTVTSQVIAVRSANVQFRPNDNAAFRPNAVEVHTNMPIPGYPPAPIPAIPTGTARSEPGAAPPTGDPRYR